uniref:Predicted protein n=1 Tax=Physcomitrium patens TaxID=3218 RepID=A9U5D3_PHYPA
MNTISSSGVSIALFVFHVEQTLSQRADVLRVKAKQMIEARRRSGWPLLQKKITSLALYYICFTWWSAPMLKKLQLIDFYGRSPWISNCAIGACVKLLKVKLSHCSSSTDCKKYRVVRHPLISVTASSADVQCLIEHIWAHFTKKVIASTASSLHQNIVTASTCETCPIRYWPTENTFLHTRILLDENERLSGVHFYETEMAGQSKLPINFSMEQAAHRSKTSTKFPAGEYGHLPLHLHKHGMTFNQEPCLINDEMMGTETEVRFLKSKEGMILKETPIAEALERETGIRTHNNNNNKGIHPSLHHRWSSVVASNLVVHAPESIARALRPSASVCVCLRPTVVGHRIAVVLIFNRGG